MIEVFTGEHGGFILASYTAAILIMGALIAWVLIDGRQVRTKLAALEAAGLRRGGKRQTTDSSAETSS